MPKIVSQLDAEGFFIGPVVADESPLDEPGVYLIPAGAVDVTPPTVPTGCRARSTEDLLWVLSEVVASEAPLAMEAVQEQPAQTHESLLAGLVETSATLSVQLRLAEQAIASLTEVTPNGS